ncbi:MAG TPA: polymer-forming cytoskeletal family protein [Campylobacterales bacterium]|nr:polymer-forming cytoskeletal family protein [Campylobacterales bacterium]HHH51067.1 polymer-forming cytoskeletal family protein [Campylobacterales bacterium]
MAFFGRKKKKTTPGQSASIITPGTAIKGEIRCDGNILINGDLEGNVMSRSEVVVGKSGRVMGEIQAQKLLVSGEFKGNFTGEIIDIMPYGKVYGDVVVNNIVIEPNAVFEGETKIVSGRVTPHNDMDDVHIIKPKKLEY